MKTKNKKETVWEKLERSNPNARQDVRRGQAASDRAEGLKGTLGIFRIQEMERQQRAK